MRKRLTNTAIVAGIVGALALSSSAAHAGTSWVGYNVNLPNLQQGTSTAYQDKTYAGTAGNLNVSFVALSYLVNAKTRHGSVATFGIEVKGLTDGSVASLRNSVPAGARVSVTLTNNTWTTVTVQTIGAFKSN